jgi:selenocysteine-specific elongation factor
MIVGTAGHIDHGKTTLVRALTGIECDRLPEEKRRGITIELGYAFLDTPADAQRIGFIDVPGHERLVHTMLAGATGIDFGLLLVAADDGVMPQTREHLAVLSLLGVQRGAVVITKTDRVEADRVQAMIAEAHELLVPTPLAGAPVFAVSAQAGEGIAALRAHLIDVSAQPSAGLDERAAFRLAIDRAFTLEGVGTVVTGTVHAGTVAIGDALEITPAAKRQPLRARSLHAHGRAVQQAHAGQRCAVALPGVSKNDIARGQWLVAPDVVADAASQRIDAELALWHGEARGLRSGTPVHVHIGAADVLGSIVLLDTPGSDGLAPGASALAQIVLHAPVAAWRGDRIVLRDASASRTIAGGRVLDPLAPSRYRRTPQRLGELRAMALPDAGQRLAAMLHAAPQGVNLQRWRIGEGHRADVPTALPSNTLCAMSAEHTPWALAAGEAASRREQAVAALRRFHQQQPEELGPGVQRLRRLCAARLAEPLWRSLIDAMQADGAIVRKGSLLHLPEHGLKLSASDERLAQKLAPRLAEAGFEGAWARDLAGDSGQSEPLVRTTLARLAQRGELHAIVKDLYVTPATVQQLAVIAREVAAAQGGEVTAARFRDATSLGRKRAIQWLEYFDRVGLLRRVADVHRLRNDSGGLFTEPASP